MSGVQEKDQLARGVGRQPLYAALSEVLIRDISSGKYPPLSTLPTEQELTELYGVSRQTVRQALRVLRDRGLISSHPGIGTIVREVASHREAFHAVNSTEDLLQFVGNTQMHAVSKQEVVATPQLAAAIGCKVGQLMSVAGFLRKLPSAELPMSYVLIYVNPMYAKAQETPQISNVPIYQRIEQLFNVRVHEIQQDTTATLLDEELAGLLKTDSGEAALKITRYFYDVNQSLLQVSISFYPSSRYTQSARFRATSLSE